AWPLLSDFSPKSWLPAEVRRPSRPGRAPSGGTRGETSIGPVLGWTCRLTTRHPNSLPAQVASSVLLSQSTVNPAHSPSHRFAFFEHDLVCATPSSIPPRGRLCS